ncbi:D-2-hydroxyacid dehydrogenase [Alicyclobacillus fastidiosus]|uniref:D-2-hydroxyacid dehydrogenase n=1 Tax=Alicyclobacillus fastidiosus TaxID=392011 RepID=A0ABY6ZER7_9BACL|nr:D-2-hydroxyacid dehydrogenase [Alicyclobacillus fastidiosus]WAH41389.1 D-2-hydroxyacid dehydrogenase [Alicyclobacillus fastidiosus]GMA63004.1 2-hydroxyacid dehydrogenase [Alicyclobacillus fastidiosus]
MPKLVFVMNVAEEHLAKVRDVAPDWEIISGKDKDIWLHHLKDAEVVVGWNKDVFKEAVESSNATLRWVHNWGAGVDKFPFTALKERGIMLTNSSGVHAYPISETILGMMLALTRQLHICIQNQQTNTWHHANAQLEMHGKTVVILGTGAIGSETARLCKAFGMQVLGVRRSDKQADYFDEMYTFHSLKQALEQSDYVVNTLPLTEATRHMMGESQFASMKSSAFYINIGRGGTTDEESLITAIQNKSIAGAGLDVFSTEPLPDGSPLWEMSNVIITPHTSGSTEHYDARVMEIFLPNLKAYVEGKDPEINRVNLDLQY